MLLNLKAFKYEYMQINIFNKYTFLVYFKMRSLYWNKKIKKGNEFRNTLKKLNYIKCLI